MDSDDKASLSRHLFSPHSDEESVNMDTAVDSDAQAGVRSPPTKRVKLSPPPSPPFEYAEYSEEDYDGPEPGPPDSLVLDLLQADGSEEFNHGIKFDVRGLQR